MRAYKAHTNLILNDSGLNKRNTEKKTDLAIEKARETRARTQK